MSCSGPRHVSSRILDRTPPLLCDIRYRIENEDPHLSNFRLGLDWEKLRDDPG